MSMPIDEIGNAINAAIQQMYTNQTTLPTIQAGNSCQNGGTINNILLSCNSGCSEQDTQGACPAGDDSKNNFAIVRLNVPPQYLNQSFVEEIVQIFPMYLSNTYWIINVSNDQELGWASTDLFYQATDPSNPNSYPGPSQTVPSEVSNWCASGIYNPGGDGVTFAYGWPWNNQNTEGCGSGPGLQMWPSVNGDNSMSTNGPYNPNVTGIFITILGTSDSLDNIVANFQWALSKYGSEVSGGSFYTNAVSSIVPIYSGAQWQPCDYHACPNMQSVSRSCKYEAGMMIMFGLNQIKNFQNLNFQISLLLPKLYLWIPYTNASSVQDLINFQTELQDTYDNSYITTSDEILELTQLNSSVTTWNGAWCNCSVYYDGQNYQVGYPSNAGSIQGCGQGAVGIAGCGPFGSTNYGGIWYTVNSFDSPTTVINNIYGITGLTSTSIYYIPNYTTNTNSSDSNFSFNVQLQATGSKINMIVDVCQDSPILINCPGTEFELYSPTLTLDATLYVTCTSWNSITIQNITFQNVTSNIGNVDVSSLCGWLEDASEFLNFTNALNGAINTPLANAITGLSKTLNSNGVIPYTFTNNDIPVGLACDVVTWLLWLSSGGIGSNKSATLVHLERVPFHEKHKVLKMLSTPSGIIEGQFFSNQRLKLKKN